MPYENLDALLNEVDVHSGELQNRVLEIRGKEFTLPPTLTSLAVMDYALYEDINPAKATALFLLGLLGEKQYYELLELVPRLEHLAAVSRYIMQFYAPNENSATTSNPNLKPRQIRKK